MIVETGMDQVVDRDLEVWRGHVVSTGQRVQSTTYSGSSSRTEIQSMPEIWVKDRAGQEFRFADYSLAESRVGHEVVIVGRRSKEDIMAFRNLTTGLTFYSRETKQASVSAVQIMCSVTLAILFAGMAWLHSFALYGEDWARKSWQSKFVPQVLQIAAFGLAFVIPEAIRRKINKGRSDLGAAVKRKLEDAS